MTPLTTWSNFDPPRWLVQVSHTCTFLGHHRPSEVSWRHIAIITFLGGRLSLLGAMFYWGWSLTFGGTIINQRPALSVTSSLILKNTNIDTKTNTWVLMVKLSLLEYWQSQGPKSPLDFLRLAGRPLKKSGFEVACKENKLDTLQFSSQNS